MNQQKKQDARLEPSSAPLNPSTEFLLNKVPEVTIFFWAIKILCTTVGETAADLLNERLHLGLSGTSLVMSVLLVVALIFQFKARKYVAGLYWLAVVLISIVGTLITDNLSDNFGISLVVSTLVFTAALIATFLIWYVVERTLSIHTIFTSRREAFYWLAILFTFALGTAAGDLIAERLDLGYLLSAVIFGSLIALVALAYFRFKLDGITAFWMAYILTRPLGASLGDLLSQSHSAGGLGYGPVTTSVLFLAAILATVIYLAITKRDVLAPVVPVHAADKLPQAAAEEQYAPASD